MKTVSKLLFVFSLPQEKKPYISPDMEIVHLYSNDVFQIVSDGSGLSAGEFEGEEW